MKTTLPKRNLTRALFLGLVLLIFGLYESYGQTVPVEFPNQFEIDGNIVPNSFGDWYDNTATDKSEAVFGVNGEPLDIYTSKKLVDPWTGNDTIFKAGGKWTDYLDGSLQWKISTNPGSDLDINNIMLHYATSTGVNGLLQQWIILSADRETNNGASYIDFEFFQNSVHLDPDGGIRGDGTEGGRTVGDFILSLSFQSGTATKQLFVWEESPANSGLYTYVEKTSSIPAEYWAVRSNSAPINSLPYTAFGGSSYNLTNQFIEAAANISGFLDVLANPCEGKLAISNILIKTKTSPSSSANLVDLISPIQVKLTFGQAEISYNTEDNFYDTAIFCANDGEPKAINFKSEGLIDDSPAREFTLIDPFGAETILGSNDTIIPSSLIEFGTYTVRMAYYADGCPDTVSTQFILNEAPNISISGISGSVCPNSELTFEAPSGMDSILWHISGNGTISGDSTGTSVSVTSGNDCGTPFTLSLKVWDNGCSSMCDSIISVIDTTDPVFVEQLPQDITVDCDNVPDMVTLTATDNCGTANVVPTADTTDGSCPGSYSIERTWTATDQCGNVTAHTQIVTVQDTTD
uniref:hypothetical protein n=1 Tax=Maribellus sediminis TaxID=2696285 RepID=UPI00197F32D9